MTLLRYILIPLLVFIYTETSYSLEVDVDEIKSAKKIKFINYRGKPGRGDSVKVIKSIGSGLARGVSRKPAGARYGYHNKYSIIHATSKKEPEKLSADIFSIDRRARVTHIKNVRRILQGYFKSMYRYSERNAYVLAVFATYYNAVHRGDVNYFSKKYKSVVIKHINRKNAGISTKYYEWPGRTKLLLPLTEDSKRGKLNSIDPFTLTDEKTTTVMRKDKKLIDERKDLVKLKEKVVEKDKEKVTEDKKKLRDEKKELEKKKKKTREEEKKLKEEKEKVRKVRDPEKRKEKEKEITTKEKKITEEKKKIKKEEKKIDEKDKKLKEEEKKITKKEEQIKKEKEQIKKDEKKVASGSDPSKKEKELAKKEAELDKREEKLRDKQPDKKIFGEKLFYMKIKEYLEGGHYNNEMYMINAATRVVEFKSPVKNISGRRYDIFADGVIVITHTGDYKTKHVLTMLDLKTLEAKKYGKENVFWRSFVEIRDGFIFAIIVEKNQYYLGKFDRELKLTAKSAEKVSMDTFISFYDKYIYINRWDKKIMVLNKEDLKIVDTVKPSK